MKKLLPIMCLLWFMASVCGPAYGCTSFVEYSRNTLYGWNFDYPDTELRFVITQDKTCPAFFMEFNEDYRTVSVGGMNSNGLFFVEQMLYPADMSRTRPDKGEIPIANLGYLLEKYSKVSEVKDFLKDKTLVNWVVTLHLLFADKSGSAAVIEAGKNNIITNQDKFMVMTNFPLAKFDGKSYKDVYGAGADRYKTAYEFILQNFDNFDINTGMETLRKTWQSGESENPTQSSIIFDPANNNIYFALKRNTNKVWKLSLKNRIIESYSGFAKPVKIKLDSEGVLVSELLKRQ